MKYNKNFRLFTFVIVVFAVPLCRSQTVTTCSNGIVTSLTASSSNINYIQTSNYPSSYSGSGQCNIIITATTGYVIKFIFESFNKNSDSDSFYIHDGSTASDSYLVNTYNISTGTGYQSSGNSVYLRNTQSTKVFRLAYIAVSEIPPCASNYTTYSASSAQQTIVSHSNYLIGNYDNNMDSYWLIEKPSTTDTFYFYFDAFKTELDNNSCEDFDRLVIYDGPCTTDDVKVRFCGFQGSTLTYLSSRSVTTSGKYLLLRMISDDSVTFEGFRMQYYTGSSNEEDEDEEEKQNLAWIAGPCVVGTIILICLFCHVSKKHQAKKAQAQAATRPNIANDPVAINEANAAAAVDVTPPSTSNNQIVPKTEQTTPSPPDKQPPQSTPAPPARLPPIEQPPALPRIQVDSGYRPPPSYEESTVEVPLDLPPPYSLSVHYPLDPHGNTRPSAPPVEYTPVDNGNQTWMTSTSNMYPGSYIPSVPEIEETSFSTNRDVPPQFQYVEKNTSHA